MVRIMARHGLATVAALIALNRPDALRSHLRIVRQNGVTLEELVETITHLAFYTGWPSAVTATGAMVLVLYPLKVLMDYSQLFPVVEVSLICCFLTIHPRSSEHENEIGSAALFAGGRLCLGRYCVHR
jgi:hypothetical protein